MAEESLAGGGAEPLATSSPDAVLARRSIAAVTVGNALEFYDFVTYTFFAIQIGHAFFPSQSAYGSLMASLFTFGAGFATRPLGGVVIGLYADRVGRRPAMMLSFTLMGVAIIGMAIIPSYAQIGIAAPILAVVARLVQGFSLGGEVGPTTAYLMEAAPSHRRGFAVAWQGASQGLSAAVGGAVGFVLSNLMAPAALDAYGWRIAFLLGAVTLPFGLWLRRSLPETLHAPEPAAATRSAPEPAAARTRIGLARDSGRIIGLALVVLASGTIGTYVFNYMTTFAQHSLHMQPGPAFAAGALGNLVGVAGGLFGGWLSDRVGRRPVMIWPAVINLAMLIPVFAWITESRTVLALTLGTAAISLVSTIGVGAFYPALAESLPKRIRGGTFAIVYAVAIATFGGTTQPVITWLIHVTHSNMAPAWYLFGASALGLIARWLIVESAPVKAAAG